MTTEAEVRQFVQPFLARNPDFVLSKRLLVLKPVEHIVRGIYVDRTGASQYFRPVWAINCLFYPQHLFTFTYGAEIYPRLPGLWELGELNLAENFADIAGELAAPRLRSFHTIEDLYGFAMSGNEHFGSLKNMNLKRLFFELARGDLDACEEICRMELAKPDGTYWHTYQEDVDRIKHVIAPLVLARDRAALAALLHGWEAIAVKKLKLEKFWQPTPFPLESV